LFVVEDDAIMASNNTRYVYPKYRNTDINQNTVQTLLKTINTMSRRCKAQGNTDDVLERIRSIIVLHRPHLISSPLQLPELIVEALNPYGPQQITHNFNYKYDYNSNVGGNAVGGGGGGGFDPFGAPSQPSAPPQPPPGFSPQQPTASSSTAAPPPVQMISYNQIPPTSYMYPPNANNAAGASGVNVSGNFTSPPPPPPPSSSAAATSILPADLSQDEIDTLDSLNRKSVDSPNVFNYTELIMYIMKISIKYISTNIYATSLRQVYTMGKNFSNDLTQLISCIRRSTSIALPADLTPLCQIVSQFINAYVSLSGTITNDMVNISDLTSVERVKRLIVYTNEQFNFNWNQNDSTAAAITTAATNVGVAVQQTANFEAKNREISQLRSAIDTELAEKNGEIENLKLSIGRLETDMQLLQSKHDTIKIDNARLAAQNEQYKNETEQSRIAKNDAGEKIAKLTLNYDRLKNENEELRNKIVHLTDENGALKLKEQKLSKENASIKQTLVTTRGDSEKSSQTITSLKFSSNILEQNNNALRTQIEILQKENDELKNVSIQLNEQLARYRTETERAPPPLMDVDETNRSLLPIMNVEESSDDGGGSYSSFRVKKERQIEQENAMLSKKTLESDLEMFQNYIENVTPTNIDLINTIEKLRINLSEIEKERNESLSLSEQLKLERDSKIEIEKEVNFLRQNLSKNIKIQADILDLKLNENVAKMETRLLNISTDMNNLNVQLDQFVQFEQDQIVKYETLARSMATDVLQQFYPQEMPL
jgi:hypothetical protein